MGWLVIAGILLFLVLTASTVVVLWACGIYGPAGAGAGRLRDWLVGQWECLSHNVLGARMKLEVLKDGTLGSTALAREMRTWPTPGGRRARRRLGGSRSG